MNYWPKHIGPWLKATVTLEPDEEGLYSRLCDWCYAQEQPLPLDTDEVFKIARVTTKAHRDTTLAMLQRFFIQTDTGWRHDRIERELATALRKGVFGAEKREAELLRRKRSNDKKSLLFKQAREAGLNPEWKMSIASLANLLGRHGIEDAKLPALPDVSGRIQDVQDDLSGRTDVVVATDDGGRPLTLLSKESKSSQDVLRSSYQDVSARPETVAGLLCKRLRALGMAAVNPGDPRLLELLQLGVDIEDIVMAASEAVARGKGFAWGLARAKGQYDDLQRERAEMRKWAPGLG